METGAQRSGAAATFDEARAAFVKAWRELEPTLNEDNCEESRRNRDYNAWTACGPSTAGCRRKAGMAG